MVQAESAATSSSQDSNQAKKQKKLQRALQRSQLTVGEPFRPYDLFDRVRFIPAVLVAYPGLTPGEKLTWMTAATFLGKEGDCYPSVARLGREVGVARRQAKRWMDGLVRKEFARKILRPPQTDRETWDTNLYELLWHEVFCDTKTEGVGTNCLYPIETNCSIQVGTNRPTKRIIITKVERSKRKLFRILNVGLLSHLTSQTERSKNLTRLDHCGGGCRPRRIGALGTP